MTKFLDELVVGQPITRRDFIGGVATGHPMRISARYGLKRKLRGFH